MGSPFFLRPIWHVRILRTVADCAVDQLAQNVGMPCVPGCLDAHVNQDLMEGYSSAVGRPPRYFTRRIESE